MASKSDTALTDGVFATVGPAYFDVVDRERSLRWWRDLVGLRIVDEDGDTVAMGVGGEPLLFLRERATTPVRRGYSGLYHVAIHVPDEPALARFLARVLAERVAFSPTDHLVAKSLYLSDPDGLGLEVTVDTPARVKVLRWAEDGREAELIDVDGRRRSGLEPLDLAAILDTLPDDDIRQPVPLGTRLGHVQLSVPDFEVAYAFYRDQLGLLQANHVRSIGWGDLGGGGPLTHLVALNQWQGAGAPRRPPEMAGMDRFVLRYASQDRLDAVLGKVDDASERDDGWLVHDPAGNAIILTAVA